MRPPALDQGSAALPERTTKTPKTPPSIFEKSGWLRPSVIVGLIVATQIVALGLKVFEDYRTNKAHAETVNHREAIAIAEYLSGRAGEVSVLMSSGYEAGWGDNRIAEKLPELAAVSRLADAMTSKEDSRLHAAGVEASALISTGDTFGLSESDDFIVLHETETGRIRFGLISQSEWMPKPQNGYEFSVNSNVINGPVETVKGEIASCAPVKRSTFSVCVSSPFTPITQAQLINSVAYALLLFGPALALFGMFRLLAVRSGESEAFEGQATRAGRILKTVVKEANAGFWSWDFSKYELWLSETAAQLLGFDEAGYYHIDRVRDCVLPDHRESFERALTQLPKTTSLTQLFARADKAVWLDMRARPDPESGEVNGILMDVTEMRLAIARTKQAEQRLRLALEGFSGPFALWDGKQRLIYWNKAFELAFSLEGILKPGMSKASVDLAQSAGLSERRLSKEETDTEVMRNHVGKWFKMVERITSNGGMITMGLDVSTDVEKEVQLTIQQQKLTRLVQELERSEGHAGELAAKLNEEKLRAERSANSKSAFLANMSHELRTPLNAINGFSEIIANEMYGPIGNAKYQEYAQDILASGQHLLDMINDILDMAKIEAGKMTINPQPLDLIEPVDAAVRMIRRRAEDKDIKLTLTEEDNLPHVDADHRAIRQMILNLVSNAIKFTDEGGSIDVKVARKGDSLRVSVKDTGVGIPEAALPRLAEPFEQVSDTRDRNYEGTGLGLALTKSFAEMHGGSLTIASKEDVGTLVCFFIPIPDGAAAKSVA